MKFSSATPNLSKNKTAKINFNKNQFGSPLCVFFGLLFLIISCTEPEVLGPTELDPNVPVPNWLVGTWVVAKDWPTHNFGDRLIFGTPDILPPSPNPAAPHLHTRLDSQNINVYYIDFYSELSTEGYTGQGWQITLLATNLFSIINSSDGLGTRFLLEGTTDPDLPVVPELTSFYLNCTPTIFNNRLPNFVYATAGVTFTGGTLHSISISNGNIYENADLFDPLGGGLYSNRLVIPINTPPGIYTNYLIARVSDSHGAFWDIPKKTGTIVIADLGEPDVFLKNFSVSPNPGYANQPITFSAEYLSTNGLKANNAWFYRNGNILVDQLSDLDKDGVFTFVSTGFSEGNYSNNEIHYGAYTMVGAYSKSVTKTNKFSFTVLPGPTLNLTASSVSNYFNKNSSDRVVLRLRVQTNNITAITKVHASISNLGFNNIVMSNDSSWVTTPLSGYIYYQGGVFASNANKFSYDEPTYIVQASYGDGRVITKSATANSLRIYYKHKITTHSTAPYLIITPDAEYDNRHTHALPFDVRFFGRTYNAGFTMSYHYKGFVFFGNNNPPLLPAPTNEAGYAFGINDLPLVPSIAVFHHKDFVATSIIHWVDNGSIGNRIYTIQWNNTSGTKVELRFFENPSMGEFEIVYGTIAETGTQWSMVPVFNDHYSYEELYLPSMGINPTIIDNRSWLFK